MELKAGSSILLRDWSFWSYKAAKGGEVLHYVSQNPGNNFVVTQGGWLWTKRVFNAQIESDGRIFVLTPEQAFPAKDFVAQPAGFPIVPTVE